MSSRVLIPNGSAPILPIERDGLNMNRNIRIVGVISVVILISSGMTLGSQTKDLNLVRDIITTRIERMQNISMDYRQEKTVFLSPMETQTKIIEKDGKSFHKECGTFRTRNSFSFLQGNKRYETFLEDLSKDGQYHLPESSTETRTFTPGRTEHLMQFKDPKQTPMGYIRNQTPLPSSYIEIGLGMKTIGNAWLDAKLIKTMRLDTSGREGTIDLIWADEKGMSHVWTFDRDLGYAIVSYKCLASSDKRVLFEMTMKAFTNVSGIMLPQDIHFTKYRYSGGTIQHEGQINVDQYRLDDPQNVPSRYRIDWPNGTRVVDSRSGVAFTAGADGSLVDDQRIYNEMLRQLSNNLPASQQASQKKANVPEKEGSRRLNATSGHGRTHETASQSKTMFFRWSTLLLGLAGMILLATIVGIFRKRRAGGAKGPS